MSYVNQKRGLANQGREEVKVCVAELSSTEQTELDRNLGAIAFLLTASTLLLTLALHG